LESSLARDSSISTHYFARCLLSVLCSFFGGAVIIRWLPFIRCHPLDCTFVTTVSCQDFQQIAAWGTIPLSLFVNPASDCLCIPRVAVHTEPPLRGFFFRIGPKRIATTDGEKVHFTPLILLFQPLPSAHFIFLSSCCLRWFCLVTPNCVCSLVKPRASSHYPINFYLCSIV